MTVALVNVGIIDTGCAGNAVSRRAFPASDDPPWPNVTPDDHGSRIASVIRSACPAASLHDARALVQGLPTSALQIAEALDWLVEQQVHIINMSIGLQQDRQVLAEAIARAVDKRVLLVASAPASGASVYPAAYLGVLAVTGDARCDAGVFASLTQTRNQTHGLDFGAAPGGPDHRAHTRGMGASYASAHVSGCLAQLWLTAAPGADIVAQLHRQCRFRGRECRH